MLVREFVVLLLIASLIACPFTWYFLNGWVQLFIYRTPIGITPFIIATVLAALIVILTTGFRALKAALANPVESLRE
jgi:putative ABC transport system permease protein